MIPPEKHAELKAKLDEYALRHYARGVNAWVESTLSPEGDYKAIVHATAKGYVKEIECSISFTPAGSPG